MSGTLVFCMARSLEDLRPPFLPPSPAPESPPLPDPLLPFALLVLPVAAEPVDDVSEVFFASTELSVVFLGCGGSSFC